MTAETVRQTILDVKGLSAGYGPMRVIHDLDLIVYSGERVGLVGLNGHGKSTLFLAIAGLTGWQRGSIMLNGDRGRPHPQPGAGALHPSGRPPRACAHSARRRDLSRTDRRGTSRQRRLHAARLARTRASARRRSCEIFPPLEKLMKTAVGRLSGGERRMVAIGRGLMADASLFLVDEPSLGLAPKIGKGRARSVDGGRTRRSSAMVIAEQNVALLEGRVDRVIGMHAGKLKGEASASLAFKPAGA